MPILSRSPNLPQAEQLGRQQTGPQEANAGT